MSFWLTHPPDGDLRAYLDDELRSARLQRHLASCPACRTRLTELANTARETQQLIRILRLANEKGLAPTIPWEAIAPVQTTMSRLRPALAGAAVLTLCASVLLVDPLRAIAADWLSVFRTQKIAYVETEPKVVMDTLEGLSRMLDPRLIRQLAEVSGPGEPPGVEPVTPEEAVDLVGPLFQPSAIPGDLPAEPTWLVALRPATYTIRPDVDAINDWLHEQGVMATLDPKLDGQAFQVVTPAIVARKWEGEDRYLAVIQASSLQVSSSDHVDVAALAEMFGQAVGAPASVIDQVRQIPDLADTLLLPVGPEVGEPVQIGSAQGVYYPIGDGGALVWQEDGCTYFVGGGKLSQDELLAAVGR